MLLFQRHNRRRKRDLHHKTQLRCSGSNGQRQGRKQCNRVGFAGTQLTGADIRRVVQCLNRLLNTLPGLRFDKTGVM
ncbi:hypothetical protein D3C77_776810 [compost metagenome]